MIFRKFFSVSRNAPATQRNVISPSRQRQTLPVFFRTPDCGLSIRFVVARQRWRLGGTSARLIVKVSSNPSRKLAAAGMIALDHPSELLYAHDAFLGLGQSPSGPHQRAHLVRQHLVILR